MPKVEKALKPSKSKYVALVFFGILSGLSCVPAAPFGLIYGGFELFHGFWSDPLTKAVNLTIGAVLTGWGFFGGYYVGIRCYRKAKAIRLAMKEAGAWGRTK